MYNPAGLEAWEIVAASGLFAAGIMLVSTVFAGALAWWIDRPTAPAAQPAAASRPAVADHTAEFAGATA